MSDLSTQNSNVLLQNFRQFLTKILREYPTADYILKDFDKLCNILRDDPSKVHTAAAFIASLSKKYIGPGSVENLTLTNQIIHDQFPQDIPFKTFDLSSNKYTSSSISRFSFSPFKDYLRKNSIRLLNKPPDFFQNYYLRDFLPDSQNFYRAIGLGVLEISLQEPAFKKRLKHIYNKALSQEISLTTYDYPFPPEELHSTFCSYIYQLLCLAHNSAGCFKAREILFAMDEHDPIFDTALLSFVKWQIDEYLDTTYSKNDSEEDIDIETSMEEHKALKNKIWTAESGIINDLMSHIPDIFQVKIIVQTIENRTMQEVIYEPKNTKDVPELHILNERHNTYQNFSLFIPETNRANKPEYSEEHPNLSSRGVYSQESLTHTKKFMRQYNEEKEESIRNLGNDGLDSIPPDVEARDWLNRSANASKSFFKVRKLPGTKGVEEYKTQKQERVIKTETYEIEDHRKADLSPNIFSRKQKEFERERTFVKGTSSGTVTPLWSQEKNTHNNLQENLSTAETRRRTNDLDFKVEVREWAFVPENGTRPAHTSLDEKSYLKERAEAVYDKILKEKVPKMLDRKENELATPYIMTQGPVIQSKTHMDVINRQIGEPYKQYNYFRREEILPEDEKNVLKPAETRMNYNNSRNYYQYQSNKEESYKSEKNMRFDSNEELRGADLEKRRITKEEIEELKKKYGRKR